MTKKYQTEVAPRASPLTDPCGRAVNVRDGRDDRPKPSRMRFGS